jgi:hypothetical protein
MFNWVFSTSAGNLGSFLAGISTLIGVVFAIVKLNPRKVKISVQRDYSPGSSKDKYLLYFVIQIRDGTPWYSSQVVWEKDGEKRILVLEDKAGKEVEFPKYTDKGTYTFYAETRTYKHNTVINGSFLEKDVRLFVTNGTAKYPVKILSDKWF